jgi:hypothetical protein
MKNKNECCGDNHDDHHDDENHGSYMVRRNLHSINKAVKELLEMVAEDDEIESWMEHKISVAKAAISDVRDALLYDHDEDNGHSHGHKDDDVEIAVLRGDEQPHAGMSLNKILGGCGANENKTFLGSGAINEKRQLITNNSKQKIVVESVENQGGILKVNTKGGKSYEFLPHFGAELELLRCEGYGIKIVSEMQDMEDEEESSDLKAEMVQFLKSKYGAEADDFSVEEAIYWFASDYHGGQTSDLYSVLSTSEYKPSRLHHGIEDTDDEMSKMMYEDLVEKYAK